MNNNNFVDYVKDLKKKIKKTRDIRFDAARRLSHKNNWSIYSISFLSFYGIAISIIPSILDFSNCKNLNKLYSIFAVLLSIFILIISLLEGSQNYQIKGDRLYNNAKELSELYEDLKYLDSCKPEQLTDELEKIKNKYRIIIDQCSENHDTEDYLWFQAENSQNSKDENINWVEVLKIKIRLYIQNYWLYILSILVTPFIFVWLHFQFQC